jgi:small neutral amino acid transporter SnatA (MarC family)
MVVIIALDAILLVALVTWLTLAEASRHNRGFGARGRRRA